MYPVDNKDCIKAIKNVSFKIKYMNFKRDNLLSLLHKNKNNENFIKLHLETNYDNFIKPDGNFFPSKIITMHDKILYIENNMENAYRYFNNNQMLYLCDIIWLSKLYNKKIHNYVIETIVQELIQDETCFIILVVYCLLSKHITQSITCYNIINYLLLFYPAKSVSIIMYYEFIYLFDGTIFEYTLYSIDKYGSLFIFFLNDYNVVTYFNEIVTMLTHISKDDDKYNETLAIATKFSIDNFIKSEPNDMIINIKYMVQYIIDNSE